MALKSVSKQLQVAWVKDGGCLKLGECRLLNRHLLLKMCVYTSIDRYFMHSSRIGPFRMASLHFFPIHTVRTPFSPSYSTPVIPTFSVLFLLESSQFSEQNETYFAF